jgi:folate-binding protein YgfZ
MMNELTSGPARTCVLSDRAIVSVAGPDAEKFLGDLLTSEISETADGTARYAGLLSPQGKVLFDGLVFRHDGHFMLDVPRDFAEPLARRLSFYKLRANVTIDAAGPVPRVQVFWGGARPDIEGIALDPRLPELGFRAVVTGGSPAAPPGYETAGEAAYHGTRIRLGIPEAVADFAYGDVFPHDIGMDQLGGVDFEKGCYIGQEVVSRMQHRGTARRRIVLVEGETELPPRGTALEAGGRALGTLGSSEGRAGLAIARLDRAGEAIKDGQAVVAGGVTLALKLPVWAGYDWPADAA